MYLICPHCQSPIELVAMNNREEILCPSCGSTFRFESENTASWRSLKGKRLGRFELEESVGTGAFGSVYRARDPELDRPVAIKIPRAGNLDDREDLDRFLREGRSVAQLRHPGIVPVYEVGLADGIPYLVSEFVEGPSLSDVLDLTPVLAARGRRADRHGGRRPPICPRAGRHTPRRQALEHPLRPGGPARTSWTSAWPNARPARSP